MRSLWTAARWSVLGVLAGTAGACNYDNPGFKLKGEDATTSGSPTTNDSVSATTEPGTPTTSTSSQPTTIDPEGSGTVSSAVTTDALETGMPDDLPPGDEPWDDDCVTTEEQEYNLLADTFFMFDTGAGVECDLGGGADFSVPGLCNELSFGSSKSQQVFNFDIGQGREFNTRKVFAARFDKGNFFDKMTGKQVPAGAVISLKLNVYFKRIDNDEAPLTFKIRPLQAMGEWKAGDQDAKKCAEGEASFECQACSGKEVEDCSAPGKKWNSGTTPYIEPVMEPPGGVPIATVENLKEPTAVSFKLAEGELAQDQYMLLQGSESSYVVVPEPDIDAVVVEIHTADGGKPPSLVIEYCPNPNPKP